ncbi:MAG TPA: hypothetical protein VHU23_13145 [Rhizomicrobium sp.]|jgi:hypothetical protein|nr:hypothetical protein [Rhizomicrobium sp.]
MFKLGLLASTALIAATSVCGAATQPANPESRLQDVVSNRDANAEFLCNYGWLGVTWYYHTCCSGSSYYSHSTHAAVPVTGHGRSVSRIVVAEKTISNICCEKFGVGLYANSSKGVPGTLLASGVGTASSACAEVTVSIASTLLNKKTKYWIEEFPVNRHGKREGNRRSSVYWAIDPKAKHRAFEQSWTDSTGELSSSPWTRQSSGPFVRVK